MHKYSAYGGRISYRIQNTDAVGYPNTYCPSNGKTASKFGVLECRGVISSTTAIAFTLYFHISNCYCDKKIFFILFHLTARVDNLIL